MPPKFDRTRIYIAVVTAIEHVRKNPTEMRRIVWEMTEMFTDEDDDENAMMDDIRRLQRKGGPEIWIGCNGGEDVSWVCIAGTDNGYKSQNQWETKTTHPDAERLNLLDSMLACWALVHP